MGRIKVNVKNSFQKVERELLVYEKKRNRVERIKMENEIQSDDERLESFLITGDEYLLITVAPMHNTEPFLPGYPCWIKLPWEAKVEFTASDGKLGFVQDAKDDEGTLEILQGDGKESIIMPVHPHPGGEQEKIFIGKEPPTWEIKVSAPTNLESDGPGTVEVGDNG